YLYTLPSCVDDRDYAITHVIRGEDHVTNTAVQIELFAAIGGAAPQFAHHSLLIGADGEGLSKRLGSLTIEGLRESGVEASAVTSLLARLGTSEPVVPERSLAALAEGFSFADAGRAPARFDDAELRALSAKILHETPYDDVRERLTPLDVSADLWAAVRGNVATLEEAADWRAVVDGAIDPVIEDEAVTAAAADLVPDGPLTEDSWSPFVDAVKGATGAKGKKLFMPLRLALTGVARGPEMAPLFAMIGADKARARLRGERA
ncbi:MAG: glutamate--tRNA ligase family protein, partial [Pseudomonadota bacterium]